MTTSKEETLKKLLKGFYNDSACFHTLKYDKDHGDDPRLMNAMRNRGWKATDYKRDRFIYKQANDISIVEGGSRWHADIVESLKEIGRL